MESHELLREIFDKKTPKEVSADLSLSTSMIYKWTQPREGEGSGIENPLDRVEALYQSTGDPAAHPMDLPARRRIFHPQSQEHAASAFPDSGDQ